MIDQEGIPDFGGEYLWLFINKDKPNLSVTFEEEIMETCSTIT